MSYAETVARDQGTGSPRGSEVAPPPEDPLVERTAVVASDGRKRPVLLLSVPVVWLTRPVRASSVGGWVA